MSGYDWPLHYGAVCIVLTLLRFKKLSLDREKYFEKCIYFWSTHAMSPGMIICITGTSSSRLIHPGYFLASARFQNHQIIIASGMIPVHMSRMYASALHHGVLATLASTKNCAMGTQATQGVPRLSFLLSVIVTADR